MNNEQIQSSISLILEREGHIKFHLIHIPNEMGFISGVDPNSLKLLKVALDASFLFEKKKEKKIIIIIIKCHDNVTMCNVRCFNCHYSENVFNVCYQNTDGESCHLTELSEFEYKM